jgi:WD40 repeat protein
VRDADQEPVNLVTQRFEGTLDGRTAAAELGLKADQLGPFLKQHPDLARVFGGLITAGGTAQRQTFQENFPELARRVQVFQALALTKERPVLAGVFQGHEQTVNCVAFSADGRLAASGSDDCTVRIWEVGMGRELVCLKDEMGQSNPDKTRAGEVLAVAFSGDGKVLASGGNDRLIRIWDVATGKLLRVLERGHTDSIRCLVFAPDGKRLVSGGNDRSLRIWDPANGRELASLAGHGQPVVSVVWSKDGSRILSGSTDGTARLWDPEKGKEKQVLLLEPNSGPIFSVALSADGLLAATGGNDKTVRVWRFEDGRELHAFSGHANAVVSVQFAPSDRREVLSASSQHKNADTTFRRFGLAERKQLHGFAADPEHSFGCAVFSPDGRHVLVGGPGGFLRMWSW